MNKEEFYKECSKILNIEHTYIAPLHIRNRWSNRNLGNGRFQGFGLVQCFGYCVRIINKDLGTLILYSYDDTFKVLKEYNSARYGVTVAC